MLRGDVAHNGRDSISCTGIELAVQKIMLVLLVQGRLKSRADPALAVKRLGQDLSNVENSYRRIRRPRYTLNAARLPSDPLSPPSRVLCHCCPMM